MSDRTIGSITKLVRAATVLALQDGKERITTEMLRRVDLGPLSGFKSEEL